MPWVNRLVEHVSPCIGSISNTNIPPGGGWGGDGLAHQSVKQPPLREGAIIGRQVYSDAQTQRENYINIRRYRWTVVEVCSTCRPLIANLLFSLLIIERGNIL